MEKYEKRGAEEVIKDGVFPSPLSLHENIDYVRNILASTVQYTSVKEDYVNIKDLPADADLFKYKKEITPSAKGLASHNVIEKRIEKEGKDYRFETKINPIERLRDRTKDDTEVGLNPDAAKSTGFKKN